MYYFFYFRNQVYFDTDLERAGARADPIFDFFPWILASELVLNPLVLFSKILQRIRSEYVEL